MGSLDVIITSYNISSLLHFYKFHQLNSKNKNGWVVIQSHWANKKICFVLNCQLLCAFGMSIFHNLNPYKHHSLPNTILYSCNNANAPHPCRYNLDMIEEIHKINTILCNHCKRFLRIWKESCSANPIFAD